MPAYKALSKPAFEGVKDVHHFEAKSAHPQSANNQNQTSAAVNWESKTVHREGGLAGLGKSNRGTLLDTGF